MCKIWINNSLMFALCIDIGPLILIWIDESLHSFYTDINDFSQAWCPSSKRFNSSTAPLSSGLAFCQFISILHRNDWRTWTSCSQWHKAKTFCCETDATVQ